METYMVAFVHMCFLMEPENRKPKPEHCVFRKKSRMSWCKLTKSSLKCLYGGFRAHVLFNGTRKPKTENRTHNSPTHTPSDKTKNEYH